LGEPPEVEVVIEVPRGNFLKRGSTGELNFISPLPGPFDYGSVPSHIEGWPRFVGQNSGVVKQ